MKKLLFKKNTEVFQGEKYLKSNKNYFEGWYFKNIGQDIGISFIPGICINEKIKSAFIQLITGDNSWFVYFDINDFEYNHEPFWIRIGNNYFSKERVHIDIKDEEVDLVVKGDLKYRNHAVLKTNIMGIFSYISFMECNHSILSMKSRVDGSISINGKDLEIFNGNGYIEKDFGISFPKDYLWGQGNNFKDSDVSFMISIADVPFKVFSFRGFICSLMIKDKEYRFATYNNSKILKCDIKDNIINIIIKKGKYILEVDADNSNSFMLKAPVKGHMNKEIFESIKASIKVTLKRNKKIIFSDISTNCGLEIVKK